VRLFPLYYMNRLLANLGECEVKENKISMCLSSYREASPGSY
jgi:hypothetical protein